MKENNNNQKDPLYIFFQNIDMEKPSKNFTDNIMSKISTKYSPIEPNYKSFRNFMLLTIGATLISFSTLGIIFHSYISFIFRQLISIIVISFVHIVRPSFLFPFLEIMFIVILLIIIYKATNNDRIEDSVVNGTKQ